jgi:AcrR family transcriptional regulator
MGRNDTLCIDHVKSSAHNAAIGQYRCVLFDDGGLMPRIWAATIEGHRRQVSDAVLEATAALVDEAGPMSVTMSAIAERAAIGRATLYKYFPDVESILAEWHRRAFADRLAHLEALADSPTVTLDSLVTFAVDQRRHLRHSRPVVGELAAAVAASMPDVVVPSVVPAMRDVVARLVERGEVRDDIEPAVLAQWLVHSIHAPDGITDEAVGVLLATSLAPRSRSLTKPGVPSSDEGGRGRGGRRTSAPS